MTDDLASLDPITVEVIRNKLDGIANEMESTLVRSSFSPIVKEGLDASASLFTMRGEALAQAIAIPIHLATLIPIVRTMLDKYPPDIMIEGDIYIMNDPYCGGTHLPDIALVMPIFHNGWPVAMAAAMTHHQDVGGMSPGSVPTNATEIYQEGIRIPPLKFRDGNVMNDTLIDMLKLNVRIPETFMGDLNAQLAACSVGGRRIEELAARYGDNYLTAVFEELLDRSETMTRHAIEAIPDGVYSYVDYLDNDGIELDKEIEIHAAVTVRGSNIHIDFAGTSPQVKGPFNCVRSGSLAAAYFALRAVTDPTIPTNGGCFRPVTLDLPEGSLLCPRDGAPVNARTSTIKRVASCILGALRRALPDRLPADNGGEMLLLAFGGQRPGGANYVVGEMIASGSGASAARDGVDMIETDCTNCMNLPVEAMEMDAPIRILRSELRRDSGGPGMHRGGLGLRREYEILDGDVVLTYRGERHRRPALGADGGGAGATARGVITRRDGTVEEIPSKCVTLLQAGDRLLIETAGGGGYGDPAGRSQAARRLDVLNRKTSAAANMTSAAANMKGNDDAV